MIISTLSESCLKCCPLCCAPEYKIDLGMLQRVPVEDHQAGHGLEDLVYEESLRELGLFNLGKRRFMVDLTSACKYLM